MLYYNGHIKTESDVRKIHATIKNRQNEDFASKIRVNKIPCSSFSDKLSIRTVFEGPVNYHFNKGNYLLCPGNILAFNEGQAFSSYNYEASDIELFSVFFSNATTKKHFTALTINPEKLLDDPDLLSFQNLSIDHSLDNLEGSFKSKLMDFRTWLSSGLLDQNRAEEMVLDILTELIIKFRSDLQLKINRLNALKFSTRTEIYKRVSLARDFIEANFTKPITLNDIAKSSMLSQNHLLRNFKDAYHATPSQYISQKRLELAKTLLLSTSLLVGHIVTSVGFENQSSFGRLFKLKYGCSPEKFRANYTPAY